MNGRFKKERGFLLSEMLMVMGAIAFAIAMMAFLVASQNAREQEQRSKMAQEGAAGPPTAKSSMASSAKPMSARPSNTGLSKQEALAREKARVEELDAAKREAAGDKRELGEALAKSTREASELKAALAKEQVARAQAQSERSQAFADLAKSRAGLGAQEQAKPVDDQPRWLEMLGSAALELAVLGVAGLVGAACRRGRSASP